MRCYTIGYGGRTPQDFLSLLEQYEIVAVVDVRLRPDRASFGSYKKAKSDDKGIQKLLAGAGIQYFSVVKLGNPFLHYPDWRDRYRQRLDEEGESLVKPLERISRAFCLMCSEKRAEECHRKQLADYLTSKGYDFLHIE